MHQPPLSDAKRRIVDLIKRQGPITAVALADALGLTDVAVRQHLQALELADLVHGARQAAGGRGRPSMAWSLTDAAAPLFPDRHGELTVGLIEAVRETFGDRGLERIVDHRSRRQVNDYAARIPTPNRSLKSRVEALADLRTAEGYVAEVRQEKRGCYLLIEHHCPICEAATSCLKLCSAELQVFQKALGSDVLVERTAHLLGGDERCVYRIQKR